MPLPRGERRVVRLFGLDDGTALVAGRAEQLLEERRGDPVGVVSRVGDQEVDGPDVAAGPDGRSECEDRATDDDPLRSRDEDARLRQVDQLAHQIGGTERALVRVDPRRPSLSATSRSMSVTRAARTRYSTPTGPTSQGSATEALDRGSSEAKPGPAIPYRRWAMVIAHDSVAGCGRPVLHSGRRR